MNIAHASRRNLVLPPPTHAACQTSFSTLLNTIHRFKPTQLTQIQAQNNDHPPPPKKKKHPPNQMPIISHIQKQPTLPETNQSL